MLGYVLEMTSYNFRPFPTPSEQIKFCLAMTGTERLVQRSLHDSITTSTMVAFPHYISYEVFRHSVYSNMLICNRRLKDTVIRIYFSLVCRAI